jgi:8-oxo-dGTP diphosphatase
MKMKTIIVTACLIEKNKKFLLVQEKQPRAYKLWNLPAGKLEADINLVENAIKEAREETGYDVEIEKLVSIFEEFEKNERDVIIFVFKAKITGGKMKIPKDEILQVRWFTFEEIKKMKKQLRGKYVLASIQRHKNHSVH